jgi:hypothetical protein
VSECFIIILFILLQVLYSGITNSSPTILYERSVAVMCKSLLIYVICIYIMQVYMEALVRAVSHKKHKLHPSGGAYN